MFVLTEPINTLPVDSPSSRTARNEEISIGSLDQPAHAEELVRRTGARAIPVLEVEGRMITGFSTREYDALLREV
jgi:hypothetical protein